MVTVSKELVKLRELVKWVLILNRMVSSFKVETRS